MIPEKTIESLVLETHGGEISLTLEIINLVKSFPGFTLGPIDLKLQDNTIMVNRSHWKWQVNSSKPNSGIDQT